MNIISTAIIFTRLLPDPLGLEFVSWGEYFSDIAHHQDFWISKFWICRIFKMENFTKFKI